MVESDHLFTGMKGEYSEQGGGRICWVRVSFTLPPANGTPVRPPAGKAWNGEPVGALRTEHHFCREARHSPDLPGDQASSSQRGTLTTAMPPTGKGAACCLVLESACRAVQPSVRVPRPLKSMLKA